MAVALCRFLLLSFVFVFAIRSPSIFAVVSFLPFFDAQVFIFLAGAVVVAILASPFWPSWHTPSGITAHVVYRFVAVLSHLLRFRYQRALPCERSIYTVSMAADVK